jgi:Holliday junction DNA helicase RuvB
MHKYPQDWSGYIGQERAKKIVKVNAQSAKISGGRMDHTLITSGTPGIGKTALAHLIAKEADAELIQVDALEMQKQMQAAKIIFQIAHPRAVLFIDEAHKLVQGDRRSCEWLLEFMQDGIIAGYEVDNITIIGATTDPGKIPQTIVSRFPVRLNLEPYTLDEAALIVEQVFQREMPEAEPMTMEQYRQIASASTGNPRKIWSMITSLKNLVTVGEMSPPYDIDYLLEWLDITPDGLDYNMQTYIRKLGELGGKGGKDTLEQVLQSPGGLDEIERTLLDKGLIERTPGGRTLTKTGMSRYVQTLRS